MGAGCVVAGKIGDGAGGRIVGNGVLDLFVRERQYGVDIWIRTRALGIGRIYISVSKVDVHPFVGTECDTGGVG